MNTSCLSLLPVSEEWRAYSDKDLREIENCAYAKFWGLNKVDNMKKATFLFWIGLESSILQYFHEQLYWNSICDFFPPEILL